MSAAVGPAIGLGSSLIGKAFGGNSYASSAGRGLDATEAINSARAVTTAGGSALTAGMPLINSAASYYQRLIGGDKQAQSEAVAPQRQALLENYTGAERGLRASSLRGGARDYATAELARQKAGQIGGLIPAAIQAAVPQAASLGLGAFGAGTQAETAGGSLYNQLLGLSQQQGQFNTGERTKLGEGISGFLNNLLSTYFQPKGAKISTVGGPPSVAAGAGGSFFNPNNAFGGVTFRG